MSVEAVVAELCGSLVHPDDARRKVAVGGVPAEPGLYSWWTTRQDALPGVPIENSRAMLGGDAVADDPDAEAEWLLYVGIAPCRAGSAQTLRGRVCGNHLRGNISGSTFRLSLAALLWQQQHWQLARRGNRGLLAPEANAALSDWQRQHLRVRWAVHPRPWDIEGAVIKALAPPLNLADNRQHAFAWTLSEARQRLRTAALSASRSS